MSQKSAPGSIFVLYDGRGSCEDFHRRFIEGLLLSGVILLSRIQQPLNRISGAIDPMNDRRTRINSLWRKFFP